MVVHINLSDVSMLMLCNYFILVCQYIFEVNLLISGGPGTQSYGGDQVK